MSNYRFRQWVAVATGVLAIVLVAVSLLMSRGPVNMETAARNLGQKVDQRMAVLDGYVAEALGTDPSDWIPLWKLPSDMVVYKYVADTLQSWVHQLPIQTDDIRRISIQQRFGSSRSQIVSPLVDVTERLSYVNYGPKWYLIKAVDGEGCRVIAALEVLNELDESSFNGVNPRFGINDRFTIQPLSGSTGDPVMIGGEPLFKITAETVKEARVVSNYWLFWLAVGLFMLASLLFLSCRKTIRRFSLVAFLQMLVVATIYIYGLFSGKGSSDLFSPLLYADGPVLYSLGAVLLINFLLTVFVTDMYMARWSILDYLTGRKSRTRLAAAGILNIALMAFIVVYIHVTFKSIVLNSGITLELYKISSLSVYSGLVYLSFLLLALTVPLLLQMLAPSARRFTGFRYDSFSRTGRFIFAVATAVYFVAASSFYGFRKEQSRVDVWSNRLAMDRDISLEIQLRRLEPAIASDPVLMAVAPLAGSERLLVNRLTDSYLGRISQNYDISVRKLEGMESNPALEMLFNDRIKGGTRISDDSNIYYSRDMSGRARYSGLFFYVSDVSGTASVMVNVESKSNREDRGYLSLLGISEPGRVIVPVNYSYARYVSDHLVNYKGAYSYPTVPPERFGFVSEPGQSGTLNMDGYTHFLHRTADDEMIVISREKTELLSYIVEGFLLAILAYLLLSAATARRRAEKVRERSYYKSRINGVIYVSLTLTLVAMSVFSLYFVYRRNETDMKSIMSSKINTIQSMLQDGVRQASSYQELARNPDVMAFVESVANTVGSDISLYTPSGLLFLTTTPEIFDRMIMGYRINEEAIYNIQVNHRRSYMHKETLSSHRYYSLYAPVFNSEGEMLAIVSSPYTDQNYDLETEAISHFATIITAFLLLLIVARLVTSTVISKLLKPLSEMSRKMSVADIDHLEYIIYDRDDEISSLVAAYNRMVHDLSDSTRQLAQAERDKAWSAMARQVAHEIKNPLTPIKLQLQMLIRMKETGNKAWEDKFDEVAGVVLEHIDILADTANEFSTFAKLYSEVPVPIDLDALIRDEVMLFAGRDTISVDYFGLEGAMVEGPKPQLTRVLVNLITNSIQAIEGRQAAEKDAGKEPVPGQVRISLRHSSKDGFYDIVVEDNGPGVKEENRSKLFTPNFTTKSGGTGLGLAISRTVIERCRGEIRYSKSFTLGGACFTIRYPKSSSPSFS
ncbi:MAG: hypothetical protein IJL56_05405 [Bacteroidales bacterium]|nr:hypothetical protein [Bacteroidales bacterium]